MCFKSPVTRPDSFSKADTALYIVRVVHSASIAASSILSPAPITDKAYCKISMSFSVASTLVLTMDLCSSGLWKSGLTVLFRLETVVPRIAACSSIAFALAALLGNMAEATS